MGRARFTAELIQGHNDVTAVIVPFAPAEVWGAGPIAIDPRRDGWLVRGTVNRTPFEGWIGFRWGRHFLIIDAALRDTAAVAVGDRLTIAIEPTESPTALAIAREQAKRTTAPKRKRRR